MSFFINFKIYFKDSLYPLSFLIIAIVFETVIYYFNLNRSKKITPEKTISKKRITLIEDKKNVYLFNKLIKNHILFDKIYFKNSPRTHYLFLHAIGFSFNLSFFIITFVWLGSWVFDYKIENQINIEIMAKSTIFFFTSIAATYWNLKIDQNKKFDYCLSTYNQIIKDTCDKDKDIINFREVNLAIDILTMDLWAKRVLSNFFYRKITDAIPNEETEIRNKLLSGQLTENEVYELLVAHAQKIHEKIMK